MLFKLTGIEIRSIAVLVFVVKNLSDIDPRVTGIDFSYTGSNRELLVTHASNILETKNDPVGRACPPTGEGAGRTEK